MKTKEFIKVDAKEAIFHCVFGGNIAVIAGESRAINDHDFIRFSELLGFRDDRGCSVSPIEMIDWCWYIVKEKKTFSFLEAIHLMEDGKTCNKSSDANKYRIKNGNIEIYYIDIGWTIAKFPPINFSVSDWTVVE